MDALLLRSLQSYVLETFGASRWQQICLFADHPSQTFEPMLKYEAGLADKVADISALVLDRSADAIWEDVGIFLVANPQRDGLRRLLRFGGLSFEDFLHSLEELPGRAWVALPHIDVPEITLTAVGTDRFELQCRSQLRGVQRVLIGVVTAMADDYGALCLIEPGEDGLIRIYMPDSRHAAGRAFDLARQDP